MSRSEPLLKIFCASVILILLLETSFDAGVAGNSLILSDGGGGGGASVLRGSLAANCGELCPPPVTGLFAIAAALPPGLSSP